MYITSIELANQYKERAKAEREGGGNIDIDWLWPCVSITMSDGRNYYYQEWEAQGMLDNVKRDMEDCGINGLVTVKDYILAIAQIW